MLYMTGRHRYLICIQSGIALMIVTSQSIVGSKVGNCWSAFASAVANVGVNICYLITVKRTLGLFPYDLSYFRLLLPSAGMVFVLFVVEQ